MCRSTEGRSHTTQQRPRYCLVVMPTSGRVRPHKGWRGSTMVTACVTPPLCSAGNVRPKGGVGWLRFPYAWWTQQDNIGRRLHKAQRAQFLHEALREARLEGEVETLAGLAGRQMGGAHAARVGPLGAPAARVGPLGAPGDLRPDRLRQERLIGPLLLARSLEHLGNGFGQRGQSQSF